jgi:hypothetical protein
MHLRVMKVMLCVKQSMKLNADCAEMQINDLKAENKKLKEALKSFVLSGTIKLRATGTAEVTVFTSDLFAARNALRENNWVCPLDDPNCKSNCGNYGCGN